MIESIQFAESILANLPGGAIWKDAHLNIIAANMNMIKMAGFSKLEDIVGLSDYDVKCGAVASAAVFRAQDKKVMHEEKEITVLDIHPYADGHIHAMLTKRAPLYNEKRTKVIGSVACSNFINAELYRDFFFNSFNLDKKFKPKGAKQSASIDVKKIFDFARLTEVESCILYYYIRQKNAQEISVLLGVPCLVVNKNLNNLKNKMGIFSQADMIMYCIENGFINYMPLSLLPKDFNLSLELTEL